MTRLSVRGYGNVRWGRAWLDAVAFVGGLAMAWWGKWDATDLIWSLWLSSLTLGSVVILWSLFGPLAVRHRESIAGVARAEVWVCVVLAVLFLANFGGIHLTLARYLKVYYPVGEPVRLLVTGLIDPWLFAAVVAHYWYFVPLALIAERQAFQSDWWTRIISAKVAGRSAPKVLLPRPSPGDGIMRPYKNVIWMNLMLGLFVLADQAKLESFTVYSAVYVLYFFPWRLLLDPLARSKYLSQA